ncbi:hypothetical protein [Marinobacterium weihaiense]|uniref:Uncharacterized protein n=1 Tax=Marinobacterium weihaiense TaxID=2851016 RepID=A0ABS6MDB6_9GAMM|nr:hypothetical protein [Marinobacterium weihaiense]MBV0934278.1 hypothetical protein [Marinobacterium weihaiense]
MIALHRIFSRSGRLPPWLVLSMAFGLAAPSSAVAEVDLPAIPVLPPLQQFDALLERPLFVADRQPHEAQAESTAAATAAVVRERWRLTGILLAGQAPRALLRQRNGTSHRVLEPGMHLDEGWVLAEIRAGSVVLQAGEQQVEIPLREPRATAPANRSDNGTGAAASQPDAPQPKEVPNE